LFTYLYDKIHGHEDIYFSYYIDESINYKIPQYTEAQFFSVETLFCLEPFGIHNCWHHLEPECLNNLINKYPEIKELIDLQ
jgi:hypothetical protein